MAKRFVMNEIALENYGEKYRGVVFEVTHTAKAYMPAEEFYKKGMPEGYHPGYDTSERGGSLYDLKFVSDGTPLPFSLYHWEVTAYKG